ncbi:rho GTPase-activating protein 32 isoform X2 [Megalops cyprinoides]|uniref:rho GTPase-activating protein 32 isoform X2 n=1 Tax=Megalops cyprinoides TaxID=118141 RepID=UPI00186486F0|nr:rho GTPase-activating protein 32 isoform X2 [Megalops cyprinoides]
MESGSGSAALGSAEVGLLGAAGSHDAADRGLRPGRHPEEDDIVPELARSIHPRERPDWEETISAMARSAEIPELSSEPLLRSCSSTASMKVKNVKKLSFTKGHFPKLAECAHFHYENVDFGTIQLALADEQNEVTRNGFELKELVYLVQICCQGRSWIVRRSYEDFRVLDKHLHLCIYDRRFSQLPELPRFDSLRDRAETVSQMLMAYLSRLSAIADNKINCGPALTWMEIDNKGNHLLVHEDSCINVPAIAAAHVIKRYIAQAADELSFEVGDIVSVIDMPPKEDTTWWRGKHGFQVGFFPSECVELINDKLPQSVTNSVPKPVSRKHGKLITFLRSFMKSRPTKQKLKQRGILRERVFGCDLGEHLLNSGHDVPQVLKSCTEFIEKHGVVDGMYRLSGIASNIQKLRHEFDSEQIPDLTKDVYIQDIHCVGSLCKLYFRELPNPLLTYQLYEKFSEAVSAATDEERLIKIHDVIQQLPPPHYRTLEFLMRHLSHLATFSYVTNMHSKNLAIVWAPNLLRSKQIESACFSGTAAFMEVRIQSVVVEFILNHVDVLFSPKLSSLIREGAGHNSLSRPKSLLVSSPSTKLLTLEEAQARTQAQINSPVTADSKYIEVGEGPAALQGKFHTVIEFPMERKRPPVKVKKSPVGSWRSFFNLGKSSSMAKRKLQRNPSEPNELKAMALTGGRGDTGTLRSAKSEESLSSLHNVDGESKVYRPRRPRSSSDALSASFNGDLLDSRQQCNSYDNLTQGESDGDEGPIRVPALISPPRPTEDVDLSPPDIGMASLDFDPMSFQCSPPAPAPAPEPAFPSPSSGEGACPRRSPGSASGSEPTSPSLEKFACPFLSPDLSPALGDRGDGKRQAPASFAEKMAQALSPKIGRKSTRVAPLTVMEPAVALESTGVQPSPPLALSQGLRCPPSHTSSMPVSEGCQHQMHCKLSSTSSPDSGDPAVTDCPDPARPACGQKQPGAVVLDSPQGPNPVSSVSLLPPPPPPKNAARMLALALAESAQQAAILSQRRPSEPPTPISPLWPQAPLDTLEWPPPPPLQSPTATEAAAADRDALPTPTSSTPAESQTPDIGANKSPPTTCAGQENHTGVFNITDITAAAPSQCAATPAGLPAQVSPARKSPQRQQPAAGQAPNSGLSTPPSKEAAAAPQRSSEVAGTMLSPALPKTPEPPAAGAQHQPNTRASPITPATATPTPVTPATATPAPVTPVPSESVEKPWEAIKPVHPWTEPVPHYHAHEAMPPPPPVRSIESKLATAALSGAEAANASNFHVILAEAAMPASVEEVLPQPPPPPRKSSTHQPAYLYHAKPEPTGEPYYHQRGPAVGHSPLAYHYRPESVPPHLSYVSKSEPQIPYSGRADSRYSTLGPRSFHQSIKSRGPYRGEYAPAGPLGHHGQAYGPVDGAAVYPTIRRVHSLHVASSSGVRSVPISRTEVPPDNELFYYQRPVYQCKPPYQQAPQTDYHVTQLQPYFENGRVHYRYSPYSGGSPLDAPYYDVDPYGTIRLRHFHSFSAHDLAPTHLSRPGGKTGAYHYLSRHVLPAGREHSFVSRDMPPSHGAAKAAAVYLAWDPEESDRLRIHSIRRESRARHKARAPVMSQYDNVGPFPGPGDLASLDILHPRSKSDPGKAVLVASDGKEGQYAGASASQHTPRYLHSDPEVLVYMETERRCPGNGTGDKPAPPPKERTSRGGPLPQHHELTHPDPRGDPGDGRQHAGRAKPAGGYPEEEPQPASKKAPAPPKPERSHSVRERAPHQPPPPHPHPQENPEPLPYQPHEYRHSTMTVLSHYDNLDDYHPIPQPPQNQPQTPGPTRGSTGTFPAPGFAPPHSNRAYSTALGQGAFVQAELSLQRPETEVRAE